MNLEVVPKSFWHSLSIAMLAFTIGFLFISYKYGDLTVKFNQLELRTTNTVTLEQSLAEQEATLLERDNLIKQREGEIDNLMALLDAKAKELDDVKSELASLQLANHSEKAKSIINRIDKLSADVEFDKRYQDKKDALVSLEKQQQETTRLYDQQRNIYDIQQRQQQMLTY